MAQTDDAHLVAPNAGFTAERLNRISSTQSTIFYAELLPALYQLSIACVVEKTTILDIGPGSGAGTGFLHNAFNHLLGWPAAFTGIDINPRFELYVRAKFPDIDYIVGDALDDRYQGAFDLVLCSHALEHIANPRAFVERCNGIARKFCPFHTPYAEHDRWTRQRHRRSPDRGSAQRVLVLCKAQPGLAFGARPKSAHRAVCYHRRRQRVGGRSCQAQGKHWIGNMV